MAYTICVSQLLQEIPSFLCQSKKLVRTSQLIGKIIKMNTVRLISCHMVWLENKNKIVCFVKYNMTFKSRSWGMVRSLAFGAVAFRED